MLLLKCMFKFLNKYTFFKSQNVNGTGFWMHLFPFLWKKRSFVLVFFFQKRNLVVLGENANTELITFFIFVIKS